MISENEQSSDKDADIQYFVSQEALQQVELRSTTPENVGSVPIDSLPQLSQMIEAPGVGPPDDQLAVLLEARLSRESSLSTPSDTLYSVVSPQDSSQPQVPFVEGNSASPANSSGEMGIRTDMRLESTGKYMDKVLMPNSIALTISIESHDQGVSAAIDSQNSTSGSPDEWFPYTLSWQYLSLLAFFTLALMITVIVLYWYSATHYGLWDDNDSAITFFGWRFAPSLFAVIYVQMTAMLLEDVKRTEPFARMARPGGALGASTILQSSGAWWNALFDGISKKKNGGRRSWLLISSSLINILGFLTISPLSPSLLEPVSVAMVKPTNFTALLMNPGLQLSVGRETYMRILGNILQNVSTSAWISDEYVAVPVRPSYIDRIPSGSSLLSTPETWYSETIVMNTDLDCRQMELKHSMVVNETYPDPITNKPERVSLGFSLSSGDGCIYNISIKPVYGAERRGRASWGNLSDISAMTTKHPSECDDSEFIVSLSPADYDTGTALQVGRDFNVSAYVCTSRYYMAKMEVTAHSSGTQSDIFIDEEQYHKERTQIPITTLNTTALQEIALSSNWSEYTPFMESDYDGPIISGLALPLSALYDFDIDRMIEDQNIVAQAKRIKQRIFGEAVQYSLLQRNNSHQGLIKGRIRTVQRRVCVVFGVAITVIVLLQVSLVLLIVVWLLSQRRRRVLSLREDPAKTSTACSLIANQPSIRGKLLEPDHGSDKGVYETIRNSRYHISPRALHEIDSGESPLSKQTTPMSTITILITFSGAIQWQSLYQNHFDTKDSTPQNSLRSLGHSDCGSGFPPSTLCVCKALRSSSSVLYI